MANALKIYNVTGVALTIRVKGTRQAKSFLETAGTITGIGNSVLQQVRTWFVKFKSFISLKIRI